jgi:hypothetical protein
MGRFNSTIAAGVLLALAVSVQARSSTTSQDLLPVDPEAWTLLMGEPRAHLLRAREDLADHDLKAAAAEIRMADHFLDIQEIRLAISTQQLGAMADDVQSGAVTSPQGIDRVFRRASGVIDDRENTVPAMPAADAFMIGEVDDHLAQARVRWTKNDVKSAAEDLRRAAAYLTLKAVHAGERTKSELASSAAELNGLARKADAGGTITAREFYPAAERARNAVRLPAGAQ